MTTPRLSGFLFYPPLLLVIINLLSWAAKAQEAKPREIPVLIQVPDSVAYDSLVAISSADTLQQKEQNIREDVPRGLYPRLLKPLLLTAIAGGVLLFLFLQRGR
ncbi:MAG: hypothetical protein ABH878_03710 [bacterium]